MAGDVREAEKLINESFDRILADWCDLVVDSAGQAATSILNLSSKFLSDKAYKALADFYKLYFGDEDIDQVTENINRDVDLIIEAQNSQEKVGTEGDRLSLSGIQKQLEMIIRLDAGIHHKLLPVLTNMQFEDLVRHRIGNISNIWDNALKKGPGKDDVALDTLARELSKMPTSLGETRSFCKIMFNEEGPEGDDTQTFIDLVS